MKAGAKKKKTKYREIVINTCYGRFSLSATAILALRRLKHEGALAVWLDRDTTGYHPIGKRDDPRLVEVVRELGASANGRYAKLQIIKVPLGVEWYIEAVDGWERVEERHRSWG